MCICNKQQHMILFYFSSFSDALSKGLHGPVQGVGLKPPYGSREAVCREDYGRIYPVNCVCVSHYIIICRGHFYNGTTVITLEIRPYRASGVLCSDDMDLYSNR